MDFEKLSKENKKLVDDRLKFIFDYYDLYDYLEFLYRQLSYDEKLRIVLQLESMTKIKRGDKLCSK